MDFTELITDITIQYTALIRYSAAQFNLTTSQAFHLISIPLDGIPMSELAHKLGLDASTLTRNIEKLEKLSLVQRERDSYDKRTVRVICTPEGFAVTEKIENELNEQNFHILDRIDLDLQENMADILEKLGWSMVCHREN